MRPFLTLLHRWFGLAAALFLIVSGLTGAVISWDHELDEWLNPQLFHARSGAEATARPALELAAQYEASDPRVRVSYLPLATEPGHTLMMSVDPRIDPATGKAFDLDFNQVALDPATGEVQGKRFWGAISLTRENLLPFLYKLHYTMHIPDGWGVELGLWFMGIIAIVWVFDCFVALWLSFPKWSLWRKSFAFRWRKGGHVLNFDLHRSGGVIVWLLLLVLAVTAVSMNLGAQVMRPVVSWFSPLSPDIYADRTPNDLDKPIAPGIARENALAIGRAEAAKRGWTAPAGAIYYASYYGTYGIGFFELGQDHGDGGLGNPWLYFEGKDGAPAGGFVPGTGSAGDIFMQAQFPLHSGRILGIPGRVLISAMGLIVAMLSITGLVIWAKKRAVRVRGAQRRGAKAGERADDTTEVPALARAGE